MRVGFDITALYVAKGGVYTHGWNLVKALLEVGEEQEFLLLDYGPLRGRSSPPPELDFLRTRAVKVVHCGGPRVFSLTNLRAAQRPGPRRAAAWLDRTLLRPWLALAKAAQRRTLAEVLQGSHVFHSSDVLQWRQPGAFNVITIQDLTALLFPDLHTPNNRELQLRVYRFAQEQADAVIVVSENTRLDAMAHLGIPPERIHVVYSGVGPEFRPLAREAVAEVLEPLGLRSGGYLLFVGTIEPRKNLERLLRAYAIARGELPAPVPKLVLAGAKGPWYGELMVTISALGLEEDVRYLGPMSPSFLPALYNGAAALVYPSLYEGFGFPPLEAMACGVPVVISDTSAIPEVVGESGLLVDPTDAGAIAEAVVTILADSDTRARLRASGLERGQPIHLGARGTTTPGDLRGREGVRAPFEVCGGPLSGWPKSVNGPSLFGTAHIRVMR